MKRTILRRRPSWHSAPRDTLGLAAAEIDSSGIAIASHVSPSVSGISGNTRATSEHRPVRAFVVLALLALAACGADGPPESRGDRNGGGLTPRPRFGVTVGVLNCRRSAFSICSRWPSGGRSTDVLVSSQLHARRPAPGVGPDDALGTSECLDHWALTLGPSPSPHIALTMSDVEFVRGRSPRGGTDRSGARGPSRRPSDRRCPAGCAFLSLPEDPPV